MSTYIYYESTTPSGVTQWELLDNYKEVIHSLFDATDNIISDGLHEIAGMSNLVTMKFIIYFENQQSAESYINNPPNVISLCSDPAVVTYCKDNNIIYSISVNDTSNTLTEIIASIDNDNFSSWSIR